MAKKDQIPDVARYFPQELKEAEKLSEYWTFGISNICQML